MTTVTDKKVKTFPQGGVHPADAKLSAHRPIERLPLPRTVRIPIRQHLGAPAVPVVNPQDKVKAGQLIAKAGGFVSANIHASVSGTVAKIERVLDTSGYKNEAVIIDVEGDEWAEGIDLTPDLREDIPGDSRAIVAKVQEMGIVGLGGATFPSHVKLSVPEGKKVEYLMINGVECEPFLTSDHRIMLERTRELVVGIRILLKALNINKAMVGIENNKPDAIERMRQCAQPYPEITVHALRVLYPQGGERQLIKSLLNREVPPPPKGLPLDVGCVVFNVATVFAVYEAIQKNKPLVERVVTVTGRSVKNPSNFLARIGTSVAELIEAAGGLPEGSGKVINGGPMMGKALSQTDIPVTKGIGGILVVPEREARRGEVLECIRCAKCVSVCPLGLEPYLLMNLTQKALFERAERERILNCCECGCCSFICPSNRPLLDYMRIGKATVAKLSKAREKQ